MGRKKLTTREKLGRKVIRLKTEIDEIQKKLDGVLPDDEPIAGVPIPGEESKESNK